MVAMIVSVLIFAYIVTGWAMVVRDMSVPFILQPLYARRRIWWMPWVVMLLWPFVSHATRNRGTVRTNLLVFGALVVLGWPVVAVVAWVLF